PPGDPLSIAPPELAGSRSAWAAFVAEQRVPPAARLVIALALVPHVCPRLLDILWSKNDVTQRGFTEFGGLQGASHGGFIPTGETAAFLLAGDDLASRFAAARLFDAEAMLARHNLVRLAPVAPGEPELSGALVVSRELLHRFTTGLALGPRFS